MGGGVWEWGGDGTRPDLRGSESWVRSRSPGVCSRRCNQVPRAARGADTAEVHFPSVLGLKVQGQGVSRLVSSRLSSRLAGGRPLAWCVLCVGVPGASSYKDVWDHAGSCGIEWDRVGSGLSHDDCILPSLPLRRPCLQIPSHPKPLGGQGFNTWMWRGAAGGVAWSLTDPVLLQRPPSGAAGGREVRLDLPRWEGFFGGPPGGSGGAGSANGETQSLAPLELEGWGQREADDP